jgi:hypothetical protein
VDDLVKLAKSTKNPKKHYHKDIEALATSISDLGFKGAVFIDKDGTEIGAGVGRIVAAARRGLLELPVFRILDLDKAKFKKFRISDNRLNQLSNKWDEEVLFADLSELSKLGDDISYFGFEKFNKMLAQEDLVSLEPVAGRVDNITPELPLGTAPPSLNKPQNNLAEPLPKFHETPSELFPSDNEFGIPSLSMKRVPDSVPYPVVKWGEISRHRPMPGCWHFYIEDSKFLNLINDPLAPLCSSPAAIVEPNFSVGSQTPKAHVLWWTYWKRWIGRKLQTKGVNVFVDLNVAEIYLDINFLGVPPGYTAYATRGYNREIAYLGRLYEAACNHAGTEEIVFLVYGGGKIIKDFCAEFSENLTWVPERMEVVHTVSDSNKDGLPSSVTVDDFHGLKT